MKPSWWRSVEQIMLAATDSKTRVLGIVSPDQGAGVSTLCQMIATSFASSGSRTLLVDLTETIDPTDDKHPAWVPGSGTLKFIKPDPNGFELIDAPPTRETRHLFNNVHTLRQMFADELSAYKSIIVDLPAILDQREDQINPVAAARACDAVIMVCVGGRTRQERVKAAVATLATAGVQLGGTVLNDIPDANEVPPIWRSNTFGAQLSGVLETVGTWFPPIRPTKPPSSGT